MNTQSLDRYITGNYGEDQFEQADEISTPYKPGEQVTSQPKATLTPTQAAARNRAYKLGQAITRLISERDKEKYLLCYVGDILWDGVQLMEMAMVWHKPLDKLGYVLRGNGTHLVTSREMAESVLVNFGGNQPEDEWDCVQWYKFVWTNDYETTVALEPCEPQELIDTLPSDPDWS